MYRADVGVRLRGDKTSPRYSGIARSSQFPRVGGTAAYRAKRGDETASGLISRAQRALCCKDCEGRPGMKTSTTNQGLEHSNIASELPARVKMRRDGFAREPSKGE